MARKTNDEEKLDSATIERVIKLLEPSDGSKPITKKDACAILNIAYNTTRLTSIIDKYKERKLYDQQKRAEKRGKPATPAEVDYAISAYLEGATVDAISKSLYRSSSFIVGILQQYGVPLRNIPHSYFRPRLIPEEAMRSSFTVGEKVYSARYDSLAEVRSEFKPGVYLIYLLSDKQQQFAYQEAAELASLQHLRELGVNV